MSGFGYNVLGFGANASSAAAGGASDDQFNRTSFLSHFDGANNGVNNAFDDGSASNHTITANGNVTQGSFGPFARPDGEWGVAFDGASDYLDANDGPTFGTGAFTIEFFINFKAITTNHIMFDSRPDSTNGLYPMIWINSSGTLQYYVSTSSVISGGTMTINTWHHVAVSRTSTSTKMFLDGTQVGSTYSDSNNYVDSGRMRVGTSAFNVSDGYHVDGVISNLRVVNSALYTSNFTAPTTKLTAVTNTKLLTCQSNRFVDNSADGLTMTPSGNSAVTAFGPFLTSSVYDPAVNGASAYLQQGDSDYLQMPAQTIPTGSFTLEGWYYLSGTSPNQSIISQGSSGNSKRTFFGIENGEFTFQMGNTTERGPYPPKGSWNYFACVYNSSYPFIKAWHNGVSTGATTQNNGDAENVATQIGTLGSNWGSGFGVTGYVSDIRVTSGIKYTANNITIPTSPLAVEDSNTKLLLNMADAQAIDSAAQNNLTLYGTAKTSTAQYKFGTASLLLDGNSDYATFPENAANDIDGGTNWTVEFFWRFNNKTSPQYQEIITKGNALQIYSNNGGLTLALTNIGSAGGSTLDNDTWYHIAVVKNGTAHNLYLNGTSDISITSSSNLNTNGHPWYLGTLRTAESTYASNGYMDEVRISKFARYTSNFTAPSEPFADKGQ